MYFIVVPLVQCGCRASEPRTNEPARNRQAALDAQRDVQEPGQHVDVASRRGRDSEDAAELHDRAADAVVLERASALHVLEHRGLVVADAGCAVDPAGARVRAVDPDTW